jgi:2-hydroxychromene-2-carboxylate isomerase
VSSYWHWGFLRRLECLFYFTLRCRTETEELGSADLPALAAAHDVALRIAPAFRAGVVQEGGDPDDCAIEVSDQRHHVVWVVPL